MTITRIKTIGIEDGSITGEKINLSSDFVFSNVTVSNTFYSDVTNTIFETVNAAFSTANISTESSTSAGVYANAAFAAANNAVDTWVRDAANSGSSYANSAYDQANTATLDAAQADQRAVTSGTYANSAYGTANTKLSSSGGTISGDLQISGNLIIVGNTVTHSANDFIVDDPIILIANNNVGNLLDLGFVGHYVEGATTKHTGLIKDVSGNVWYLFDNYEPHVQETNILNVSDSSFRVANLTANLITDVVLIRGYDPINHTNSAYGQANTGTTLAQASFDFANTLSGGSASDGFARDSANSASSYANSAYNQANTSNTHSVSSFDLANTINVHSVSAYNQANTATTNAAQADQRAVTSGDYANSGFGIANTANQRAVTSGVYANSAYNQANTTDQRAVTSGVYANSAFGVANTANILAQASFDVANINNQSITTTSVYANAAYNQANSNFTSAVTQLVVTTPVFNYNIDQYSGDNPEIYVTAGETIAFDLNQSVSHPFAIRVSNGGSNYNTGLTHVDDDGTVSVGSAAQGKYTGKLYWKVPFSLAGLTYVYQCTNHSSMVGNIVIQPPASFVSSNTQIAFDVANAASSYANGAFNAANNAVDTWVRDAANSASSYANGAFVTANTSDQKAITSGVYANAAFDFANTLSGGTADDGFARNSANAASSYANSAYVQANTATTNAAQADQRAVTSGDYANSAYTEANTRATISYVDGAVANLVNSAPATLDTLNELAAALGDDPNFATTVSTTIGVTGGYANAAFSSANVSDQKAVTSGVYANAAYVQANTANSHSVSSYDQANTATTNAVQADQRAVTSGVYANVAYTLANTANSHSLSAYDQANTATTNAAQADQRAVTSGDYANSAFYVANNATDSWVRDAANSASSYANSAYTQSNTNTILAQAAFNQANTSTGGSAGVYANAAFDKANTVEQSLTGGSFELSVQHNNFIADGSGNTFTLTTEPISENYILVSINGVIQHKSSYNVETSNVIFSEVPDNQDSIDVVIFYGANSAAPYIFDAANAASSYANSAYAFANTLSGGSATDAFARNTANAASSYANGSFTQANVATNNAATADQKAISAGVYANAAFTAANNAVDTWVRDAANSSSSYANSAYVQANTATTNAATVDQRAVTSGDYANSAYTEANTRATISYVDNEIANLVNSAPATLDTLNELAAALGDDPNFATTVSTTIGVTGGYANAAYDAANVSDQKAVTSGVYANSSFDVANTANSHSVSAYDQANTATTNAATADQRAVTSGVYANSAYAEANNKLNLSGGSVTGDISITGNLTVTGCTATLTVTSLRTSDHIIDVGFGTTGTPTQNAGIRVFRGDLNPVQIRWVEDDDYWEYTNDGANYIKFGSYSDGVYANAAFAAANNATDSWVRDAANSASSYSNSAFDTANTNTLLAQAAFNQANTGGSSSAGDYANSAYIHANAAFQAANSAGGGVSGSGSSVLRTYDADGTTTNFTVTSGVDANTILVTENGLIQEPIADYSVSGTTLTFTTAPAANVRITIRELATGGGSAEPTLHPFLLSGI